MLTLSTPPHIQWAKESNEILVINALTGQIYHLQGIEMSVWNWLTLSYSYPKLREMVGVANIEEDLTDILQHWIDNHLLEVF